jgi:hypothetical protein
MRTAILLFAFLGVAPAVFLSAFLLCTSPFTFGQRIHSVIFIQSHKLTVDTELWLPLLVLMLGVAFLGALILMIRGHS